MPVTCVRDPDLTSSSPLPTEDGNTVQAWARNVAVAILIVLAAAWVYQAFLPAAPSLWYSTAHDRNGHYRRSQKMADALAHGDLPALIKEIHGATVWPPFHPLVTGAILAVGGNDYRLAVLSSLGAWAATCWFAFALARRLEPRYKDLAGSIALLLTLASPAHRAFATDIMLESLGAALTLAALYYYVSARQERSAWRGICCGLLLLALFLTKYNYWLLLAAGLLLSALWEFRAFLAQTIRALWHRLDWRNWLTAQLRHPVTYLLLFAFGLALAVALSGGLNWTLAGQSVTIDSADFPALLCFAFLLLRVGPWWWRHGRQVVAQLPTPARQLVQWHGYPLCIWFLWPKRLGVFLWYVTCTHHGRAAATSPRVGSAAYYWQCLAHDYHVSVASLVVVLILIVLAVSGLRRYSQGGLAVPVFLAVAALLTNYHSANRSRFLHSWVAVAWVVAGVSAARSLDWITELIGKRSGPSRLATDRPAWRLLRAALPWTAFACLVCLQGRALFQPGHAEEGGPQAAWPGLLPVADAVLPELADARQPVVISDIPFELLLDWRRGESQGCRQRLLSPPPELLAAGAASQLAAWLKLNACDSLVLIDSCGSPDAGIRSEVDFAQLHTWLVSSGAFVPVSEWHFPAKGIPNAQVWRRVSGVSAQSEERPLPVRVGAR